MVFGCVSSEGDVMPPDFFQDGLKSTSDGYVELLNTVVEPWIRRIRPLATPLGKVKNGCPKISTTSPVQMFGLQTPQTLTLCGAVKKDTNLTPSSTKAQLMDKIKTVFAALPRETVASANSRFRSRTEAVIDANGGYFERILSIVFCRAEDGRFEIGDMHETGLYDSVIDEGDDTTEARQLKRSHSTGDLVVRRGRLSTRHEEPSIDGGAPPRPMKSTARAYFDCYELLYTQHDERPEEAVRRLLLMPPQHCAGGRAGSGRSCHGRAAARSASSSSQRPASSSATPLYLGQSSLEDTTTSDSLNADLEVTPLVSHGADVSSICEEGLRDG
ncbi:hypothetical protein AAG570_007094 [Ranatra chinensis]|uniref:Uncharacterized protein n=1 Tax=Ranatra chinensis TaxID=642074 RepID=A0ABD0YA49_9HEMI